ncbi:MAG TPA: hypothetical protein VJB12_02355 [Candidatus Nanoarchaeia archaeon]|nr:hypothetical protein [Candidatus Nanoarchaeia archaeon]
MAELVDYKDKLKRYFWPESKEALSIAVAIVVIAFIISFKEWGDEMFDAQVGLLNFLRAIFIVGISFIAYETGTRMMGLYFGYRAKYRLFPFGLLFGLIACFLANGSIWILLPAGFAVEHLTAHRLGWFRYGINVFGQGMMALGGPIACIALIIIIKIFSFALPAAFVDKAILFNTVFVITQMLPIPPLAGSKVYFGSRLLYAFTMPAIVAAIILLSLDIPIILSVGASIVIGVILWILYYAFFEQNTWKGLS